MSEYLDEEPKTEYHKIDSVFMRDPETRYQTFLTGQFTCPEFEALRGCDWVGTEKIDGTNIRVEFDAFDAQIVFKGRTSRAQIPSHLLEALQRTFDAEKVDEVLRGKHYRSRGEAPWITLYGEGYGARIQKGGGNYIPDGCGFILFDIQIGNVWMQRDAVSGIGAQLGLSVVPEVYLGNLDGAIQLVREGFTSQVAIRENTLAEGLVLRPRVELLNRMGRRIITKLKHKDFLADSSSA